MAPFEVRQSLSFDSVLRNLHAALPVRYCSMTVIKIAISTSAKAQKHMHRSHALHT